jgi:hypothetical protein
MAIDFTLTNEQRKLQADAGNFGMQRRRVHGVMADPSFNPCALMDDEPTEFTKAMETIDTVPGPATEAPQMAVVG